MDLALVEFTSEQSDEVAKLGDSETVRSGSSIDVAGFLVPTLAITESIWNFSPGVVTANAKRPLRDGYGLVYTNQTLPGMSGGAVLNEQGQLIAIHGRADATQQIQKTETIFLKTGFKLGIPINTFLSLASQVNPSLGFESKAEPPLNGKYTADDWYLRAVYKYRNGDFRGAQADLDQSLQKKSTVRRCHRSSRGATDHLSRASL